MPQDDLNRSEIAGTPQSEGAASLASSAVSVVKQRQAYTASGARQFILDHLIHAVLVKKDFFPNEILDELRGYRLSVDAVIDIYVPAAARILGEKWQVNELDFASVTVGSMRLQSLLSIAAVESMDFIRPIDNSVFMLIVVPLGEQHTLGAFVLAAQLRRLGVRVDVSFCESAPDLASRVICDTPDMVLFSASSRQNLETVSHLVLDIAKVLPEPPCFAVGGSFAETEEIAKEISGVNVVTSCAREALSHVTRQRATTRDQENQ